MSQQAPVKPCKRLATLPRVGFVSLGCPKALVDSEQILTQLRDDGTRPDVVHRRGARVAEHSMPVRIRTAADDPAVAEHDERGPRPRALEAGGQEIQRHVFVGAELACPERTRRARPD